MEGAGSAHLSKPITDKCWTELVQSTVHTMYRLHSTQQGGEKSRLSGPVRLWDLGWGSGRRVGVIVFGGGGGGPVGGRTLNAAGTCRPSLRLTSHHLRDRRGKRDRGLRHSDSSSSLSREFSKCVNSIRHFISVFFS